MNVTLSDTMALDRLYEILARENASVIDYDEGGMYMEDIDYAKEDSETRQFMQQFMAESNNQSIQQLSFAPPEYTDVLPPPNHDDVQVQVMAFGYMLLFLLGTCGNVAVLTMVMTMVRSRRAHLDNTLIYMVVLSCVDFGVCLSLPFTVIDQILGFWMFGSTMCKLHAVLENFGKVLSALIITAMSFDRFAGVCLSHIRWLRSRRLAICILIGMAIYALVALCPLLLNFKAREVILFQKETGPNKMTRMRIEKCTMVEMSAPLFTLFTCFLFVLCYLVPLFLVTFFYTKLLSKLYQHARQFKTTKFRSQIPLMRISLYTLAVACFYFICWTPFWVATAFAVYLEYAGEPNGAVPPMFVYCMYFIHALPFTNSAINWILYGAMNGQLQQRIRHSGGNGTTNNGALTTLSMALCRSPQPAVPPEFFLDHRTTTLLNGNGSRTLSTTVAITSSTGECLANGAVCGDGTAQQLQHLAPNGGTQPQLLLKAYGRTSCQYRKSLSCSMDGSMNCYDEIGPIRAEEDILQQVNDDDLQKVNGNEQKQRHDDDGVEHQRVESVQQTEQHQLPQQSDVQPNWPSSVSGNCFNGDAAADEAVHEHTLLLHSSESMDLLLRIECESTTYL